MQKTLPLSLVLLLAACGQQSAPSAPAARAAARPVSAQKSEKDPKKPPKCSVKLKDTTRIFTVQGSGPTSPLVGQTVTLQGVVTGDYQAAGQLGGFFVQDFDGDGNPATSDGLFVYAPNVQDLQPGDYVQLRGTVKEFGGQTQLDTLTNLEVCASGYWVQSTPITLPLAAQDNLENYEGMAVTFPETLTVTEVYGLGRYGEIALSSGGRLFTPTNGNVQTTPAQNAARRILLDDGSTRQNPNPIPYLSADGPGGTRRVGDTVQNLSGVLSEAFGDYRVQPTQAPAFVASNPRTPSPKNVGGSLKVSSFNVLNYFTDFGQRGANNQAEFERQQAKIVSAIKAIDADALGLMEVENNGDEALENLVGALNAAYGGEVYRAVRTGKLGTDAIKVAIIYKPALLNRIGDFQVDQDPILDRPTLAQTFQQKDGQGLFTLAVNHFKSKGSCPASGDVDQGQGCWNQKRVRQAQELVAFTDRLRAQTGDADVLAMGDLNSYGAEDPIKTLEGAGFVSLNKRIPAEDRYSYVFDGQSGYLDHALASKALDAQVTGITEWHINSDEPVVLDYNTEYKTDDRYAPTPYRSSDHDPVVVGLQLAADPVRAALPDLRVSAPASAQSGSPVVLDIKAQPADGSRLSALNVSWGDGSQESLDPGATSAQHAFASAGSYSVTVKASDANGQSVSQTLSLNVSAAPAEGAGKLVISQVYGGGGNSGAPYQNDFVELFNAGKAPVALGGLTLQYASASGTFNGGGNTVALPAGALQPGAFFLVALAAGSGSAPALPTPDATGGINLSAASGKIALVRGAENISGHSDPDVLDFVGYGSANDSEGGRAVGALSNTTSAQRLSGGCADSDVNAADFSVDAPAPHNSASPLGPCA